MSKRILVIEDEPEFRDVLTEVLENAGYLVDDRPFLASAVGDALTGDYDLITLDLRLPEMDGVDIAGLFKRCDRETPILVISGYLTGKVTEKLHDLGIRHIAHKPLGVSQIVDAVKDALAGPRMSGLGANGADRNGHSSVTAA